MIDVPDGTPAEVVEALKLVGYWAEKAGIEKGPWLKRYAGDLVFNSEYEIDPDDAIRMAIVLLGWAKRKGCLED